MPDIGGFVRRSRRSAYKIARCVAGFRLNSGVCDNSIYHPVFSQYSEYEKVVIEDRVAKEQARRKAEQEEEELKAAVKVS